MFGVARGCGWQHLDVFAWFAKLDGNTWLSFYKFHFGAEFQFVEVPKGEKLKIMKSETEREETKRDGEERGRKERGERVKKKMLH
ncbi:MATE efflux family protein 7 [Prunus dulcis]|uniref:MATE efflux family protein 7 n=1 Tax=Prunus dulcis TaxID=3755 RepID=A0A4Y1RYA8_PRUDU|nr:MATE efflux family protein 7 [Prunus dulcis]